MFCVNEECFFYLANGGIPNKLCIVSKSPILKSLVSKSSVLKSPVLKSLVLKSSDTLNTIWIKTLG